MFILWNLSRFTPFVTQSNDDLKFKSLWVCTNHHFLWWLVTHLNSSLWHMLRALQKVMVVLSHLHLFSEVALYEPPSVHFSTEFK